MPPMKEIEVFMGRVVDGVGGHGNSTDTVKEKGKRQNWEMPKQSSRAGEESHFVTALNIYFQVFTRSRLSTITVFKQAGF